MLSLDTTSTNDATSTATASDAGGSFATDATQHMTHTLTTDTIIRECIKQGFYRNPICNEKLYLHNRGFDSIHPTAFEPYTDVKVLWLEGNGFASLPCGVGYTQVQPPVRVDPFAALAEGDDAEACVGETAPAERHVDPSSLGRASAAPKTTLPTAAEVPPKDRDAFSSLYPTVRQLYLHNNLFRVMPDLSRFQRLDSVNLSGNFISTVESHCEFWQARAATETKDEVQTPQREGTSTEAKEPMTTEDTAAKQRRPQESEEVAVIPSTADAKTQRAAQLEEYRRQADSDAILCEHCPLPEREEEEGAPARDSQGRHVGNTPYVPRQPPMPEPEYRNPCSSLRNLNLAGNRLETFEDCVGLLSYKALAVLDLSHNNIQDGEALLLILERLPRLQSLKLSGNPLVRTLPRYRKRLLSRCKALLYLDDRPVFEEERRLVTAWARAGDDGEEKERRAIQQEKAAAEKKRLDDFRRLIARHHDDARDTAAPHADYVRAITTSVALSAAADTDPTTATTTTTTHAHAVRSHRPSRLSRRSDPAGRRPSSDPDNSPTSSDSEEDNEGAYISVDADTVSSTIAPTRENSNKPVPARAPLDSPTRVLSSNQRVAPGVAAMDADNDENSDDIFIP
jgi:hypothetical protein